MITAVIVEDEKVIREGLEKHIPWKQLGVDQIYTAQQAEQAFEICDMVKPDIIVSDIRMPGMDGIELCRNLRKKYEDSQIIFVTGFSDKAYLKAAIELHAVSYVEKPVNVKELMEAVNNAVNQIRKTRTYEKAIVYSVFMNSDKINYVWTRDNYFSVGLLYFKNPEDRIGNAGELSERIQNIAKKHGLHICMENVNDKTEAFLFSDGERLGEELQGVREDVEEIIKNEKQPCFFSWGKEIQGQESINESYNSALVARGSLSYKGWNLVACSNERKGKLSEVSIEKDWMEQFARAITRKESEEALDIVNGISRVLKENHIHMDADVKYLYYAMYNIILRFQGSAHEEKWVGNKVIENAETIDKLNVYICDLVQNAGDSDEENKNSYIVQRVTDYILEHYQEKDLSIRTLAEQVYLTPTYLSNLYKKRTGMTIGQYLVNVRVENAINMLKDPKWKLYQIAPMVGYEDPNYFAKIFKKKVGITPSEYRDKMVLK